MRLQLPVAGYGMLMRLIDWYWESECPGALPASLTEIRSIARAHKSTWSEHSETILKIFADLKPSFDHEKEWRASRHRSLEKLNQKSIAARRARNLTEDASALQVSHAVPQRRSDIRQAAAEARVTTAKEKGFAD